MGIAERKQLYSSLETIRGHPLIVYATSIRPMKSGQMAQDVIPVFIDEIRSIPNSEKEIDLLIISNGGDPIASSRIIGLLRERFERINVLVPFVAFSAATILAMGADKIIMHPFSNLGPIDPQMSLIAPKVGGNQNLRFSSEDLRNYIEFVKQDLGVTDQTHLMEAFKMLSSEVGTLSIGSGKRGQQLSITLGEKMLETHMEDHSKASEISKKLNSSYYHHGYAVTRKEAISIGLDVELPSKEVEDLMWAIWSDISTEMKNDAPFDWNTEIMNDPNARQAVMNPPSKNPSNSKYNLSISSVIAIVESVSLNYCFKDRYELLFWREQSMEMKVNATQVADGWQKR